MCPSSRNNDLAPIERSSLTQNLPQSSNQRCRFKHTPLANQARRHPSFGGAGNNNAALMQYLHILLRCDVFIHPNVHRRSHDQRTTGRKRRERQQRFRLTGGQLGDGIGRRWRNHESISPLYETHMQYVRIFPPEVRL